MSLVSPYTHHHHPALARPVLSRAAVNAKLLSILTAAAIGLGVFLSGFVFREPAPYELYMAGLIAIWFILGLRLSRGVMPLLALFILFNIGGMMSVTQGKMYQDGPLYVAVSLFLAFSAVFYAAVIEADHTRLRTIARAYVVAAVLSSALGIAAYFRLIPETGFFLRYGRAAGGFEDPNVFGPFLVFPAIWLMYGILTGPANRIFANGLPLAVIVIGLLLSFSRGAWGLLAFCTLLLVTVLLVQNRSSAFRLRILVMAIVALAMMAIAVIVALQLPQVRELFETRLGLQEYDTARFGRFARYAIGFAMAMEHPVGIGPLEFGYIFGEDTHNIWLKAVLDYGWLGLAAYVVLTVWTLSAGFRILFRARAWQPFLICAYVALVGHIALGTIIDTDHWRHFYMILGAVWGCIALEARHQRGIAMHRTTAMA